MFNLIPFLSTVLPVIAGSLLIVVFAINLYFNIRRKFPISVNCWFCNSWTKVPYDDRNSYDCPTCLQYNGFTKDGDYNKIIPEQHDELMNKSSGIKTHKTTSNGLCILCNNNQQLKIFQLANFVPLVEENYDVEIEHFQKQLEKAYKLCKKCDKVLKKTLDKQNAWLFGNRVKSLCKNGFAKVSNQIKKGTALSIFAKIDGGLPVLLVFSIIFITISSIKFFTKNIALYVPKPYLPLYNNVISAATSSKVLELSFNPYFSKNVKIEPYFAICGIAIVLHSIRLISGQYITTTKINQLLCWFLLLLTSWVRVNKNYSTYILLIEAFCCIYLVSTAFNSDEAKKPAQKVTGKSMRKLVRNLEYTCSDVTDTTDFENISTSSNNCTSSRESLDYLNKSSYSTLDVPLQNRNFATAGNVLNSSFASARTTCDSDLNRSLNNLHLGFKSPKSASSLASFALKRPKPVLSPPKFQTVNSWVAGGFWRDGEGVMMPVAQRTNLSRSSSESSGFGSQHNENTHFVPKSNCFGDFDKLSINSEFLPHSPSPTGMFAPSEFRKNTFYPNLQQNNMLMIQRGLGGSPLIKCIEPQRKGLFENWSDKINSQATQSFRDLSLRSNNIFQ